MTKAIAANNATGTLASAITTTGATSCVLTGGQGALFPTLSGGNYFYATIVDASNNKEIVKVTANAADTFTMVRAQEGTTALTFAAGCKVELRPTAAGFNEKLAAGNDLSDVNSASTCRTNLGLVIGTNVPSPTGTGASGSWGINITGSSASCTGNAATATTATTATTANALATGNNYQMNSLGVGTAPSGTAGQIRATDDITAFFSDDRLKTRLGKVENALDKIDTLSAFFYEPSPRAVDLGYEAGKRQVGLSAQEVQKVLPEVAVPAPINDNIPEGEERDYLTLKYERIIALLVVGIQELRAEVKELKDHA